MNYWTRSFAASVKAAHGELLFSQTSPSVNSIHLTSEISKQK